MFRVDCDTVLIIIVVLVLFVYVACYVFNRMIDNDNLLKDHWFLKWFRGERTVNEYFTNKVECDVALVNERLKNANASIVYLMKLMEEVETIAPKSAIIDAVERKEKERKETYVGTYTTISAIEEMIDRIKKKLLGILKVAKTQSYQPKTQFNLEDGSDGFTLSTAKECDGTKLKEVLRMIRAKLEEIEYRVDFYLPYVEILAKYKDETKKEQKEAIADINNNANKEMSGLLGVPVDMKLDKQMEKRMEENELGGVEPTDSEKDAQVANFEKEKANYTVDSVKKQDGSEQRAIASQASSSHMAAYGSRAGSQSTAQDSMKGGTDTFTKKIGGSDAVLNNDNGGNVPKINA